MVGVQCKKHLETVKFLNKNAEMYHMLFWRFPWCNGFGGARGVMVIVAGYVHGETSSNPGPDWLHFT